MTDQEQITEVEERLMSAVKDGNVDLLEGLLHDDVLFIDNEGRIQPFSKDLETCRSGDLFIKNIDPCDKQISCREIPQW